MKKALVLLVFSILLTGCVSDSDYRELEARVSYLESLHSSETITEPVTGNEVSDSVESIYSEVKSISFDTEFNTEDSSTWGEVYQLTLKDDKCTLYYLDVKAGKDFLCDFSKEKFYDVLNVVTSCQLEEYESPVDDNGKIVYETVPHMLGLYINPDVGTVYYKDPVNINDIILEFEKLREAAE